MRPADLLYPHAGRPLLPGRGDVHIDPVRPVARALVTHGHSDHARAGPWRVLATAETLGIMAVRYGEDFAGATQAAELGEPFDIGGVNVDVPSGRACARLGPDRARVQGPAHRRVGRLQARARPDLLPFEPVPCDVFITEATFGLPVFRHPRHARRGGQAARLRRAVSGARASRRRLRARQGAAPDGAHPRGRLRRADLHPRRAGEAHRILPGQRHRARRRRRKVAADERAKLAGAIVHLPAGRRSRTSGRAASPIPSRLRLGLDAGARPGAAARRRTAACRLRPCRLGRLCRTILETGAGRSG